MKKQNKKTPLVFRLGIALVCAMLLSAHFTGGLLARYTAFNTGSDGARTALFSFEDDFTEQTMSIAVSMSPGESFDMPINIKNSGEVTIRYTVKFENLTGNLPIAGKTVKSESIKSGAESEFIWQIDWPAESNSIEFMGKTDVLLVCVSVEQVD